MADYYRGRSRDNWDEEQDDYRRTRRNRSDNPRERYYDPEGRGQGNRDMPRSARDNPSPGRTYAGERQYPRYDDNEFRDEPPNFDQQPYQYIQQREQDWQGPYGSNYSYDTDYGSPRYNTMRQGRGGSYNYRGEGRGRGQGDYRGRNMGRDYGRGQDMYSDYGNYRGEQTSYAGRGPKGWQRSDERIREEASEELARHHEIDPSDVELTVENGEITLEGTVENRWMKRHMEDIVYSIYGVHDVHNRVRINREDMQSQESESGNGTRNSSSNQNQTQNKRRSKKTSSS